MSGFVGLPVHIEVARDGQEALDYLVKQANDEPRLVLLDLRPPSMDGLTLIFIGRPGRKR